MIWYHVNLKFTHIVLTLFKGEPESQAVLQHFHFTKKAIVFTSVPTDIAVFKHSSCRFSKKNIRPFQQNASCWVIKLNMYKRYMSPNFPSGQYMSVCACATVLSSGNSLSWADRWLSCRHLGLPSISAQLTLVSCLQPWDTPKRRAIGALSVFSEIIMSLQACTIENSPWKHTYTLPEGALEMKIYAAAFNASAVWKTDS